MPQGALGLLWGWGCPHPGADPLPGAPLWEGPGQLQGLKALVALPAPHTCRFHRHSPTSLFPPQCLLPREPTVAPAVGGKFSGY